MISQTKEKIGRTDDLNYSIGSPEKLTVCTAEIDMAAKAILPAANSHAIIWLSPKCFLSKIFLQIKKQILNHQSLCCNGQHSVRQGSIFFATFSKSWYAATSDNFKINHPICSCLEFWSLQLRLVFFSLAQNWHHVPSQHVCGVSVSLTYQFPQRYRADSSLPDIVHSAVGKILTFIACCWISFIESFQFITLLNCLGRNFLGGGLIFQDLIKAPLRVQVYNMSHLNNTSENHIVTSLDICLGL